jgi:hypothetical protein
MSLCQYFFKQYIRIYALVIVRLVHIHSLR